MKSGGWGIKIFFFFKGPCILQAQSLSLSLFFSLFFLTPSKHTHTHTHRVVFLSLFFFLSLYFPFFSLFTLELATCAVAIETAQKQNDKQIIHYRVYTIVVHHYQPRHSNGGLDSKLHYRCSLLSNTSLKQKVAQRTTQRCPPKTGTSLYL